MVLKCQFMQDNDQRHAAFIGKEIAQRAHNQHNLMTGPIPNLNLTEKL